MGRSQMEVAKRHGLSQPTVSRWCRQGRSGEEADSEDSLSKDDRIARLERMVGQLAMENAFLKKYLSCAERGTSERSSIVTAKTLASRPPAGLSDLPAAPTITSPEAALGTQSLKPE